MGFGLFDSSEFMIFLIIFLSLPGIIISTIFYFLVGEKLIRWKRIIIAVLLFVGITFTLISLQIFMPDSKSNKLSSIESYSSYNYCCKERSNICNNMVCHYDFIIKDKDFQIYCEHHNGRILPSNLSNPSYCRKSNYNPSFHIPDDYDECTRDIQNSNELNKPQNIADDKLCQLEIYKYGNYPSLELQNRNLLFDQCSNHPNVDKSQLTDNYCSIIYFK